MKLKPVTTLLALTALLGTHLAIGQENASDSNVSLAQMPASTSGGQVPASGEENASDSNVSLAQMPASTSGGQVPVDTQALAKQSQNPVADLISVPIQTNFNFGVGPFGDTQNVTLIQPVIPQHLSDDWNWIHRGIIPVPMYQPGLDSTWGIGDIQYEGFLSPSKGAAVTWGVGPYLSFPTGSADVLSTGKFSAGPAIVVLAMPGQWVVGGLVTHLWSYAGDGDREDVNLSSFQYFINYNIPDSGGWYLTTSPTNTFNWSAGSGESATIPLGGGFGRVFKLGDQHMNAKLQAFGFADAPSGGPDWSVQFQLTLLFPQ